MWIVEWQRDKTRAIWTPTFDVRQEYVFPTPDGQLWAIAWSPHTGKSTLWRLVGTKWEQLAPAPNLGTDPRVINSEGPPWFVLVGPRGDHANAVLLKAGKGPGAMEVGDVEFAGASKRPRTIYDGMSWTSGQFLLATDIGVLLYDVATDSALRLPFRPPTGKVSKLCRDGIGRVWLAGDGLWVTDTTAATVRNVGPALPIMPTSVWSLAADPDHRDGVILALGRRGGLFLRAAESPAP